MGLEPGQIPYGPLFGVGSLSCYNPQGTSKSARLSLRSKLASPPFVGVFLAKMKIFIISSRIFELVSS